MKSPRVVITDGGFPHFQQELEILRTVGVSVVIGQCKTEDEVIEHGRDADGILVQWAPISRRVIAALNRCKIIARYGLGVDMIDVEAATELGIVVVNAGDYCVIEVAEHTIAMILACARKLKTLDRAARLGSWDALANAGPMRRFADQKVGIFGFGTIGELVAQRLHGLGFSTLAYDPLRKSIPPPSSRVDLETLLRESDLLTIHAPLTTELRGFFNRARLRQMKPTAFIINTARGPIINEGDLLAALTAGEIAGAALDVLEKEPPSLENSLLHDHRVLVTPHAAYYSEESLRALQRTPAEEVARFFRGEPLRWALNLNKLRERS